MLELIFNPTTPDTAKLCLALVQTVTLYMCMLSSFDYHIKSQFVLDIRQLTAMLFTMIGAGLVMDFTLPIPMGIANTTCCKLQILNIFRQEECHVWVQCIQTHVKCIVCCLLLTRCV